MPWLILVLQKMHFGCSMVNGKVVILNWDWNALSAVKIFLQQHVQAVGALPKKVFRIEKN